MLQTELEISVLASCLWQPQLTATAVHRLPDDLWNSQFAFQDSRLRQLADCIRDCWQSQREANPVNVANAATFRGYPASGVEATIRDLMSRTPGESEATLDRTAADLADLIRRSRLQSLLAKGQMLLADDTAQPAETISGVVSMINANVGTALNIVGADEAATRLREQYNLRKSGGGKAIGIPSGLPLIDKVVGGIPTSAVTIIGARPSQGKTAMACCIALHAAKAGFPVIFFSHEMSCNDIYMRMTAEEGNLSYIHIKKGRLSPKGEEKLSSTLKTLEKQHLAIIDTGGALPSECRTTAMYLVNRWGLANPPLIVVDYVQLEHLTRESRPEFRPQELMEISHYWCDTAKLMGAGVILLSQLNRDAAGSQPTMAQLANSGALEQDATAIMLLWRPAKDRRQELANCQPDPNDRKKAGYNWGVLSVAKSRNSDLTEQELYFSGYNMKFRAWDFNRDQHLTKIATLQAEYNNYMADVLNTSSSDVPATPRHAVDDEDVPQDDAL